jgi:hypothetical protein
MALFHKTDPALKLQRDLEAKLKAKRTNRDNLIERRKATEASAVAYREKARKLAGDGAEDTALSAAEVAMRGDQDRITTLDGAISDVEAAIASLELEIAGMVDRRCRSETAAAVTALADKWASLGAAFDVAVGQLADLARESAVITLDAHPLQVFLDAVKQQVPPAADVVASVLRDHAKAVLVGTAPAFLPKPEPEPAPFKLVEPPPTELLFTLRSVRWTDAQGVKRIADQYTDAALPPDIARRALKCRACVPISDPRRRELRHAHGGRHPNPQNALDLDDEGAGRPAHMPTVATNRATPVESTIVRVQTDPVTGVEFTEYDRGPARVLEVTP